MIIAAFKLLSAFSVAWLLWKTFRQWILRSPLDNIPGPPADSLFTGVLLKLFSRNGWEYHRFLADTYGSVLKVRGLLGERQLYVYDPKVLHHVFVKDQHIFEETDQFIATNNVIFGPGLLGTLGDQHRKQRKMLNPVFSIAHMRDMIPTFYGITDNLRSALGERVKQGPKEIDVLFWMTRTALELICQSGLGYSVDNLKGDDVQHPFSTAAKALVPSLTEIEMTLASVIFGPFSTVGPAPIRRWLVNTLPWKKLHRLRDIVDVLHSTAVEIYESKKKALEEGDEALAAQVGRGKDIMSILMRANMSASPEDSLTPEEITGQMSSLMFAAMDTTTNAVSRILYLLSIHKDVQEKLRNEILGARKLHDGNLTYDEIVSLPYLDAICRETLRVYAPVPMTNRVARKDVVVPLHTPIKGEDGQELNEIFVPEGTMVFASILNSNTNVGLWGSDAREWKPERWLSPLPSELTAAHIPGVYSNLMTFIGGSRACIGFKFSQLEMKVVLLSLIESFRFSPSKKDIIWQMAGVTFPVVAGGDGSTPRLPMVVERVA